MIKNTNNLSKLYDIVVIGAGSGGLVAARLAASFGVKVALIEKSKIGGDCLHTGCVPSKSLISYARKVYQAKSLGSIADISVKNIDFAKIGQQIECRQQHIADTSESQELLSSEGIDVYIDSFVFVDTHTLVNKTGESMTFSKCIISTGSHPVEPNIPGLIKGAYLTSDTIWSEKTLPASLAIIGAGPIGLELGQALAMLGSKVSIFEKGTRLVPRFDADVSQALSVGLELSGINILYGTSVNAVKNNAIEYSVEGKQLTLDASKILVAIGRTPNTSTLGLEKIGVKLNDRQGIVVNKHLQTNIGHIYAVGDCLAGPLFTHWAAEQAGVAIQHALFGRSKELNAGLLPSVTFTTPEIAQIGKTQQELESSNVPHSVLTLLYDHIDKAVAEGESGYIKVLITPGRKVLGAVIVGAHAGELIGYFSVIMASRKKLDFLAKAIHAYPTFTINIKKLATDATIQAYSTSKPLKWLLKLRGF